ERMIESISGVRGTGLLDVASSVGILDRCSNNSKPLHGWSTSDNHDVGLGLGFKRMRCCRIVHHSRIRLHDIGWFVSLVVGLCCSCSGLFCLGMERGFLFQNGSGESNNTMNEDTSVGVASVVMEGVAPSMVDMTVEMKKLRLLKDTTVLGYFPPLSMPVTTLTGNALGKCSYANVTGKPSGKKLNVLCLHRGSMDGLDSMLENGPWFIHIHLLILKKCIRMRIVLKEDVVLFCLGAGEKMTLKNPCQTSRGVPFGSKIVFPDDYDNEDEVASVDNDMARSMASERVDPYDDDMYEGQDLPQELQAICDNLEIPSRVQAEIN
ncbi:hypothetical protein Tco_0885053, partial [Tanacetum coccineum]